MTATLVRRVPISGPLLALACLLLATLLFGGSSRADLPSLMFLRPLAVVLLGYSLWGIEWRQIRAQWFIASMAAAIAALPLLQLIPLPPAIWHSLPGRDLIVEIDRAAGLRDIWRPLSLDPQGTWNAFFSLSVPIAALMLGLRLSAKDRARLLPLLLVALSVSALLGMFQILGPQGSALYFYRVTHADSAVGLFANRNHQAAVLACMFPMLSVYATMPSASPQFDRRKGWLSLGVGAILLPLILITGSRAGLIAGVIGLAFAVGLYLSVRIRDGQRAIWRAHPALIAGIVAAGTLLIFLTIRLGRAEAFYRVVRWDSESDFRFRAWHPVMMLAKQYWPVGSGYGSFATVFKVVEPYSLLHPTYFNQAHNDWLDVPLSGGLASVVLLAIAIAAIGWRAICLIPTLTSRDPVNRLAWLGLAIVVMLAFASVTDYPLRVSSIACIWAIAVVWIAPNRGNDNGAIETQGDRSGKLLTRRPYRKGL